MPKHICKSRYATGGPIGEITDMGDAKLLKTVERWLRTERNAVRNKDHGTPLSNGHKGPDANGTDEQQKPASKQPAPFFPSRHMAYFH
jgi:hypothetical protein